MTDPAPLRYEPSISKQATNDPHVVIPIQVHAMIDPCEIHASYRPHPSRNVLLLFSDGIRIDGGRRELSVTHSLLRHVQRDTVYGGINTKPMAETLRAAMRRIR